MLPLSGMIRTTVIGAMMKRTMSESIMNARALVLMFSFSSVICGY